MRDCIKCMTTIVHPFHDSGEVNEACDLSVFAMPDWHREDTGR